MRLRIAGSAAGGGFPQWNCSCPACRRARAGDEAVRARTNDSLLLSDNGERWYLLNATPDVTAQLAAYAPLHPGPAIRHTPLLGVLLTDAELDHTIGLLQLREGAELDVYAPPAVLQALSGPLPIRAVLERYASFRWHEAKIRESFPLFGGRLKVYPFRLGDKPPRYAAGHPEARASAADAWAVGYRIVDRLTGGVAVYAPGIERWDAELERQMAGADCVFVDGTFWRADELRQLGVSRLSAAEMGHVPIAGGGGPDAESQDEGSLARLARTKAGRKIYIHINNTNPILDENSAERRQLEASGAEVGYDGLEMEI